MSAAVIGIDVGGTSVKAALVATDGAIVRRVSRPTDRSSTSALRQQIVDIVVELREPDTAAVGVAVAGSVDPRSGMVDEEVTNLPIVGYPIADTLTALTGLSTVVVRDANAALIGEARAGAARGASTAVLLTLGTGVGGALLIGGRLAEGASGVAGEIGHFVIEPHGRRCLGTCRGRGHLEAYVSATAIEQEARYRAASRPDAPLGVLLAERGTLTSRDVVEIAESGDPDATEVLEEAAEYLNRAVESYLYMFNPEVVVIGGGGAEAGDILLGSALTKPLAVVPRTVSEVVSIKRAELGADAGVIGAAFLALDSLLPAT